jgi:glutamyl-Q tRNA(Asp) synthetase
MDAGLLSAVMISPRLGFLFRTLVVPEPRSCYRGRFAPSPTGPLHFGSLVAAVGSYLDARSSGGEWLVRMEDVDTPRNVPGAADDILKTLEAYGFEWVGAVLWQSRRFDAYAAAL